MATVDERSATAEVPATLNEPPPRTLRAIDVGALWANLGVSLLGFTGAIFVLVPVARPMSLTAAGTALVVGTRASYLPTLLNIVQLIGWTTFELVTIGTAMHQIAGSVPRWAYIVAGGVITTVLALRPLGWIRMLRKYVTVAVVIALGYLFVQLLRHPLP